MLSVENHRVEKFPQTDQSVCGNFVYMEIYQPPKPAYDGHNTLKAFLLDTGPQIWYNVHNRSQK